MSRRTIVILALGLCSSACAAPYASMARPVTRAGAGRRMLSAGVLVPVAGNGVEDQGGVPIPLAGFDYALGERHYVGGGIAWLPRAPTLGLAGEENSALVFNPRWEHEVLPELSVTADLIWAQVLGSDNDDLYPSLLPRLSITGGARYYLAVGSGGFVLSQQLGLSLNSVVLPGSLAIDLPIPLGEETALHLFPEVRWDVIVAGTSGALVSAGGTLMLDF